MKKRTSAYLARAYGCWKPGTRVTRDDRKPGYYVGRERFAWLWSNGYLTDEEPELEEEVTQWSTKQS